MIPLGMVVDHELVDRVAKRCLSDKDHPAQAFLFDRAHKAFGESIQIG